jgi:hypothetical protein
MLTCVGCYNCRGLGPIGSGNSADCNEFWSEGFELCSSRGCVVSGCLVVVFSFVLVKLGTERRYLEATEKYEETRPQSRRDGLKQVCPVQAKVRQFHNLQASLAAG